MFTKDTVFVLGAGASWHYGYPTGEDLVSDVLRSTEIYKAYCLDRIGAGLYTENMPAHLEKRLFPDSNAVEIWESQVEECDQLIKRLHSVSPLIIDYFLGWNNPLHGLGAAMIAAALTNVRSAGELALITVIDCHDPVSNHNFLPQKTTGSGSLFINF